MKIINPAVEIITESNPLKRIELCGRVCYKSEARIVDGSAEKFVERLIGSGHTSVLEHARLQVEDTEKLEEALWCMHTRIVSQIKGRIKYYEAHWTINARDYITLCDGDALSLLAAAKNADDYMTVRFICDRAIANELVRHRVFSFSQESTRYVNYKEGIEFVRPLPYAMKTVWWEAMEAAERAYQQLIADGRAPQEARNVLPLSTKTELVMTGTIAQWAAMLKLRCAESAHPQMRHLMSLLLESPNLPESLKKEMKKNE